MRVHLSHRLSDRWLSAAELLHESYFAAFGARVLPDPSYFVTGTSIDGGAVARWVDAGTAAVGLHIENGNSPFGPPGPHVVLLRTRGHRSVPDHGLLRLRTQRYIPAFTGDPL
jgi:hypothetical protein